MTLLLTDRRPALTEAANEHVDTLTASRAGEQAQHWGAAIEAASTRARRT